MTQPLHPELFDKKVAEPVKVSAKVAESAKADKKPEGFLEANPHDKPDSEKMKVGPPNLMEAQMIMDTPVVLAAGSVLNQIGALLKQRGVADGAVILAQVRAMLDQYGYPKKESK